MLASFLPKPLPDQAGSGLHINLSLCMDGRNLFEGDIAPDSIAGSFMAGVLAHSRELTVFTNPLPNSYQRFGCDEAPRYVSWSRQNRSQLVRIPQVKGATTAACSCSGRKTRGYRKRSHRYGWSAMQNAVWWSGSR